MKISIKTLKGDLFTVEAAEADTIADLKNKIEGTNAEMGASRQKLIHAGKVLKDEQVVSELGISESDFIVCMVTKEVAKKATPAPAPVAAPATPAPAAAPATPAAPVAAPRPAAAAVSTPPPANFASPEALASLTSMGFPEAECRAALNAAMGNPDLAYEFLVGGIPAHAAARGTPNAAPAAPAAAAAPGVITIDSLRQHPQFNMLKQLVQQNPGALPDVLNLIGQQSPELLAAIHANNDAFIAMMNEPISDAPAPAPVAAPAAAATPAAGGLGGFPAAGGMGAGMPNMTQALGMIAQMPPAQRAQMAAQMGMDPQQLEAMLQMMAQLPPGQMEAMMQQMGGMGGMGGGEGMGGPAGGNVIHLSHEEMEAVQRLMALGFTQQQAAQAYLACDKNEMLAANLLFEGGWGGDDDMMGGGYGDHDEEEDEGHY